MKGLSSIERTVLECLDKEALTYEEIHFSSGLHENICFNILQALVIKGILLTDGIRYRINKNIPSLTSEEIYGIETKQAEAMELIEALIEKKDSRVFKFQKIAMEPRDEKIFLALLSNLESFLIDVHKKAKDHTPMKDRKVIFWGVGNVQNLMNQIIWEDKI